MVFIDFCTICLGDRNSCSVYTPKRITMFSLCCILHIIWTVLEQQYLQSSNGINKILQHSLGPSPLLNSGLFSSWENSTPFRKGALWTFELYRINLKKSVAEIFDAYCGTIMSTIPGLRYQPHSRGNKPFVTTFPPSIERYIILIELKSKCS